MIGRQRFWSSQAGFTLVELMVSIVILGIGIASISALYSNMQIMQSRSRNYDIATRAARTEIEVLRNNSYTSLTPGTLDFSSSLPASLPKDRSGKVQVATADNGLLKLDVTVTYTDNGQAQKVMLSSNIGVIGIGQ